MSLAVEVMVCADQPEFFEGANKGAVILNPFEIPDRVRVEVPHDDCGLSHNEISVELDGANNGFDVSIVQIRF